VRITGVVTLLCGCNAECQVATAPIIRWLNVLWLQLFL